MKEELDEYRDHSVVAQIDIRHIAERYENHLELKDRAFRELESAFESGYANPWDRS